MEFGNSLPGYERCIIISLCVARKLRIPRVHDSQHVSPGDHQRGLTQQRLQRRCGLHGRLLRLQAAGVPAADLPVLEHEQRTLPPLPRPDHVLRQRSQLRALRRHLWPGVG